ncbi:NAD(P)/FAD-dependent oxidoreductase [Antarcticimicrobium sediminis]|uniref:FAD-binding oxidoreductase n=1 Tax=Antarcticimicrobium sediminis TaxID=2546227 RepID=A0A4R5EXU7_9RHOB|nr:FAD-binding oxidoreductase [Antarcticimicrobium sediminis]TDE39742.1 FAD-binding oxidoreductase [Antarcticimicrobium sediminis]
MSAAEQGLWAQTCGEAVQAPPLQGDAQADLVVIGGGFTGVSAALHAAQAGAEVRLLEAKEIGHGGSGRNVGLVNAGLWLPPADIRAQMGQAAGDRLTAALAGAPDLVFSLIVQHGIACEPVRAGTLHCAHSRSGMADLRRRHAQLVASGAPVELLQPAQAGARLGSAAFHGALFDPRAGTLQPLAYARGLARAAVAAGAHLHGQSPARTVRPAQGGWLVETPGGTIRARALLMASNAYHQGGVGMPAPAFTAVHFFQLATAPLPEALRGDILPGGEGGWDTGRIMSSFRMDAAGRMVIGAMGDLGHPGAALHRGWARRKLARLFPALAGQPLEVEWCGRIAMTSDHVPKVVRLGPGALSVFGYSGRGIGPGTLFGRELAQALLSGGDSGLPVPVVDAYGEPCTGLRQAFFETGAALTHLVDARR